MHNVKNTRDLLHLELLWFSVDHPIFFDIITKVEDRNLIVLANLCCNGYKKVDFWAKKLSFDRTY